MILHYKLILKTDTHNFRAEWAYPLYAALMYAADSAFVEDVHAPYNRITPVSQYLCKTDDGIVWNVSLFGEKSIAALAPVIESQTEFHLTNEKYPLYVANHAVTPINRAENLISSAKAPDCQLRCLKFVTPAAFKSRGHYTNLPTVRLILQSLIRKWNACMDDFKFEETEADALAEGLLCRRFNIHDRRYFIKGNPIAGFVGDMSLQNALDGEAHDRADLLLGFSGYAGVGIKTTLGMGGVEYRAE